MPVIGSPQGDNPVDVGEVLHGDNQYEEISLSIPHTVSGGTSPLSAGHPSCTPRPLPSNRIRSIGTLSSLTSAALGLPILPSAARMEPLSVDRPSLQHKDQGDTSTEKRTSYGVSGIRAGSREGIGGGVDAGGWEERASGASRGEFVSVGDTGHYVHHEENVGKSVSSVTLPLSDLERVQRTHDEASPAVSDPHGHNNDGNGSVLRHEHEDNENTLSGMGGLNKSQDFIVLQRSSVPDKSRQNDTAAGDLDLEEIIAEDHRVQPPNPLNPDRKSTSASQLSTNRAPTPTRSVSGTSVSDRFTDNASNPAMATTVESDPAAPLLQAQKTAPLVGSKSQGSMNVWPVKSSAQIEEVTPWEAYEAPVSIQDNSAAVGTAKRRPTIHSLEVVDKPTVGSASALTSSRVNTATRPAMGTLARIVKSNTITPDAEKITPWEAYEPLVEEDPTGCKVSGGAEQLRMSIEDSSPTGGRGTTRRLESVKLADSTTAHSGNDVRLPMALGTSAAQATAAAAEEPPKNFTSLQIDCSVFRDGKGLNGEQTFRRKVAKPCTDGVEDEEPPTKTVRWERFKRQKMVSWYMMHPPLTVCLWLLSVGILFTGLGLYFLVTVKDHEFTVDYTRCKFDAPQNGTFLQPRYQASGILPLIRHVTRSISYLTSPEDSADDDHNTSSSNILSWTYDPARKVCTLRCFLPNTLRNPVMMYIRLTNFFQNHRNYVLSKDKDQLAGKLMTALRNSGLESTQKFRRLQSACGVLQYANCNTSANQRAIFESISQPKIDFESEEPQSSPLQNQTYRLMSHAFQQDFSSKVQNQDGAVRPKTIKSIYHNNLSPDCWPIPSQRSPVVQNANLNAQYYPCGLIANSMFTDDISDLKLLEEACSDPRFTYDLDKLRGSFTSTIVNFNSPETWLPACNGTLRQKYLQPNRQDEWTIPATENIYPYPSDYDAPDLTTLAVPSFRYRFMARNLIQSTKSDAYAVTEWNRTEETRSRIPTFLIPPPRWRAAWGVWKDGFNSSNLPNLTRWERLQVWMDPAGLSTFRKLWGRNDHLSLNAGVYEINITDQFEVARFGGTKSLIFTSLSRKATINVVMSISLTVLGITCLLLAPALWTLRTVATRRHGDRTYLSWVYSSTATPETAVSLKLTRSERRVAPE